MKTMVNIEDLTFSVYRRHDDGVLEYLNSQDEGTPVPGAVFTDYNVAKAYVEEANNKDPGSFHYICVTGW
jgi:hypothetical protein